MNICLFTCVILNSEVQLFVTIAGLSYTGDQRMLMGAENLNKVLSVELSLWRYKCSYVMVSSFICIILFYIVCDAQVDNIVLSKEDSFRNLYKSSLEGIGDSVGLKVWQDEHSDNHYSQVQLS